MVHLHIIYNIFTSFLLWHSNTIKNLACIYYLTASMVQESADDLARPLVKLQLRFRPGLGSPLRLNWGRSASKLTHLGAFSSLQAASLWALISCWLSARGTSVPCHVALSVGQLLVWQLAASEAATEFSSKVNITILCSIITCCFLGCMLLVRSESHTGPAHTKRREYWKLWTPGDGVYGDRLRVCDNNKKLAIITTQR